MTPLSPKYVMINGRSPVIFASNISHSEIITEIEEITSAAFFRLFIKDGKIDVETFGRSDTLNLDPAPDDALIIKIFLGLAG